MKSKIALIVLLASNLANASITSFVCTTNKIIEGTKPTTFSFSVTDIEKPKKLDYLIPSNEEYPVIMSPKDSTLMLNDNYVIQMTSKGLKLTSDGAGCQFTTVILYKNRGFKSGYSQVQDIGGCGATPSYSTVKCIVE